MLYIYHQQDNYVNIIQQGPPPSGSPGLQMHNLKAAKRKLLIKLELSESYFYVCLICAKLVPTLCQNLAQLIKIHQNWTSGQDNKKPPILDENWVFSMVAGVGFPRLWRGQRPSGYEQPRLYHNQLI
jgi:hypothetical protein